MLHMTEAMIHCRPADKQQVREARGCQSKPRSMQYNIMTVPPTILARAVSEIARGEFYFTDLFFVVYKSTAKIGSLENFRLYGNNIVIRSMYQK